MIYHLVKKNWKTILLLSLLTVIVYANSLNSAFVSDDIMGIQKNPAIGEYALRFDSAHLWLNATTYHIFGLNPIAFRTINLLFHLANVILAFLILQILTKNKKISTLTAALFSVHPILIESVTWISGGPYVKYSFFLLLSFLIYIISASKWKKIIIPSIFFLIALSFSEKAIIFPGILFIYELSFRSLKKNWLKLAPFFAISAAWFAANFFRIGQRVEGLARDFNAPASDTNPLAQIPIAITKYFELIFWPEKLSLYQTEMFFTPLSFWIRVGITILFFLLIIFTLIKKKKLKQYFFWLSFFVIALLPTLTPLGLGWIVAERYAYLATLGILAIIATLLDQLNNVYRTKAIFLFLSLLIIITLGIRTIDRNMDWKNEDTLWIATAKVAPSGHVIHNNLGDVYGRAGDKARAIKEFQTAIAINPYYAEAMHNLANTYVEIGQIKPAIYWYTQAIKYRPALWQSYQNLAAIYFNLNRPDTALEILKKGLPYDPESKPLSKMIELIENQPNAQKP